jgi:2-iminobutanoate/2-iminopropanoate deaminase
MKHNVSPVPVMMLFMLSSVWGCAESQRSYPPSRDYPMVIPPSIKETKSLGTSWENEFGLVQGTKAGGLVFLSGQLGLDEKGVVVGKGSMEMQMRQAYANVAKVLQQFTLTMNDVLEETIYVTDMPPVLTAGPKVRREMYATERPAVASTLVQVQRLAFPDALVEIRIVAKAPQVGASRSSDSQPDDSPRRRGGRGGMGRGGAGGASPY